MSHGDQDPETIPWRVYGIRAKGESDWRYIGSTCMGVSDRVGHHRWRARRLKTHNRFERWVRSVLDAGGDITGDEIAIMPGITAAYTLEYKLIAHTAGLLNIAGRCDAEPRTESVPTYDISWMSPRP